MGGYDRSKILSPVLDLGCTCRELLGDGGGDLLASGERCVNGLGLWSPGCVRKAGLAGENEYRALWARYQSYVQETTKGRWWGQERGELTRWGLWSPVCAKGAG
jgi:hypothetical protein